MKKKILLCGHNGYPESIYELMKDSELPFHKRYMLDNIDMSNAINISLEKSQNINIDSFKEGDIFINEDCKQHLLIIGSYMGRKQMYLLTIGEVDTSRPWTLSEYDASYGIKYLDENKLVDEELNYYE